ncbi:hypothetical protein K461DRAFT_273657 [Myriangium duriaei CBS 260.36]|uniref:Prolyl 4-hydroxylase alpha subunit domain-containing protein n=1 Tax=Myriangium duriaei CBS 260.36 TaxID=1168546 RepID=A0A9P4J9S2_9PEZI|nr:hypothetical protein K461DRAFT_273657 [Myriangium duriaei CBS 260.36]
MPAVISLRTALEYAAGLALLVAYFGGARLPSSESNVNLQDFNASVHTSLDKLGSLVYPDPDLVCPQPPMDIRVFSTSPLIIHITDFVTKDEARHFIDISEGHWKPSTVFNSGQEVLDDSVRKSEKARIDRDKVVQCVEARALSFQGWPRDTFIERLWTQRYVGPDGHYSHHYDWASANPHARRASTFMVYLDANCSGGGTHFPLLTRPSDPRWCDFIDCSDEQDSGVTFLPRPRAAVFWENFDSEANGWRETLHAGMPVVDGVKVGLNIWSWFQRGLSPEQLKHQSDDVS